MLGPDSQLLTQLDQQADAGPAPGTRPDGQVTVGQASSSGAAATSEGPPVLKQQCTTTTAAAAATQALDQAGQSVASRTHTLRSFAAYADWAKRMHFSCQPCNAELQAVSQPAVTGRQRQQCSTGLPPAKRIKQDPQGQQQQHSSHTGTEGDGTQDTDEDTAAESQQQQQQQPERHSSRLQARCKTPHVQPVKTVARGGRGASPEPLSAGKAKGGKVTGSAASATPPTTPRTKAVKSGSGSRLIGAAASMLGLAAVQPESAISTEQFEAEFWRVVEGAPSQGRLVEVLRVPELRTSTGDSMIQVLQEQPPLAATKAEPQQQQQQPPCVPSLWDLSSLPARRENLVRFLPLQQAVPGLTEPVLGLSSCLSTCCWEVVPQGLYGICCLHSGAPRVGHWPLVCPPVSTHE